jgi:hypothetical protein
MPRSITPLARVLFVGLALAALALSGSTSLLARPAPFTTANGITLQAGLPLTIYRFASPDLTRQATAAVSSRFTALLPREQNLTAFEDSYRGLPRYTVPNTDTKSLLTQFTATGGFYAYNVEQVANDTVRDPALNGAEAGRLACLFLTGRNFIDQSGGVYRADGDSSQGVISPNNAGCKETQQYRVSLIRGSGLNAAPGSAPDTVDTLGALVQVPLAIPGGRLTPTIPLGGAGGHLSLLFRSTNSNDPGPSLERGIPGLAAVSMPFFDRSFEPLRNVPAVDPAQVRSDAEQRVKALYPNATAVNIPTPSLVYMVGEAGEPQRAMEPMLQFQGASVTVDGQTLIFKDFSLPAVQGGAGGFGPTVSITAPASGSTFTPGAQTTLTGAISAGTAPYTYTWTLEDGTPLSVPATLAAAGPVSVQARLPVIGKDGLPSLVSVILQVEDAEGARREALVSLRPTVVPQVYAPLVRKEGGAAPAAAPEAAPSAAATLAAATLAAVNYRFGTEMASDYPPYGASNPGDLGGVPPDVNGLRGGLGAYGWGEAFRWANSAVWERDWRDCSLGGSDCTYGVDRADLAYYSGHGGPGGIYPSNPNFNSGFFDGINARFQNVRWAMFSSCQTLRISFTTAPNEPLRRWLGAFRGAHMILGFNSNMGDVAFGGPLTDNMRIPKFLGLIEMPWAQLTIRAAWVKTAFDMNAGKPAYVYATSATVNPVDNRLPKGGDPLLPRPFPVNWYYWVWWDCADTNPADGLCQF